MPDKGNFTCVVTPIAVDMVADKSVVCYGISSLDSNSMKSANPHSGIYKADTSRTLDQNGANPNCNQGGMMVVEPIALETYHCTTEQGGGTMQTLKARDYKDPMVVCYGLDRASFNQGANAQYDFSVLDEQQPTLTARGPGGVCCQRERVVFPQTTVGAICASDYKGIRNQDIDQDKAIVICRRLD